MPAGALAARATRGPAYDAAMSSSLPAPADTPYSGLTPEAVLDALDSVGLRGDGRLIQLNSYENRVFQVFLEDGTVVVPKFYRPGRWTDDQILEEHGFALELQEAEIPVAAPLLLEGGGTLARFDAGGRLRDDQTERKRDGRNKGRVLGCQLIERRRQNLGKTPIKRK